MRIEGLNQRLTAGPVGGRSRRALLALIAAVALLIAATLAASAGARPANEDSRISRAGGLGESLADATKDDVAAGENKKLKLKLTSKAKKKLNKVIKKKTSKATVRVTATDAAGNPTGKIKFKVTVKK